MSEHVTALDAIPDSGAAEEEYMTARRRQLQELRSRCGTDEEYEMVKSHEHWTEVVGRPCSDEEYEMVKSREHWTEVVGRPCSDEEYEMVKSREHWTEVVGRSFSDEELLLVANRQHFQILKAKYETGRPYSQRTTSSARFAFFCDYGEALQVGRKIAEGGQAEIFEASLPSTRPDGRDKCVLKVFKSGHSLADLERQWSFVRDSRQLFPGRYATTLLDLKTFVEVSYLRGGTLLKDGRFAFVMQRYWGDLRKLIDLRLQENNNDHGPPFQFPVPIMLQVAQGMEELHLRDILHRDVKASNVLVDALSSTTTGDESERMNSSFLARDEPFLCQVADFESSQGVQGTGFWRAPEVLRAVERREGDPNPWTKKADVYGYAMTCYEILTGCIPLAGCEYDAVVVRGERPALPDYVDKRVQSLLRRCWHSEPETRPHFDHIVRGLQSLLRMEPAWVGPSAGHIQLGSPWWVKRQPRQHRL